MIQVRGTLDAVEAGQVDTGAQAPPWEWIEAELDRVGQPRGHARKKHVSVGEFVVMALITIAAAVMIDVIPYPGFAPMVAVPGSAGKSALDDGRTRGSLADDADWLRALRQQVAGGDTELEFDRNFSAPPAAENISVIYAGDVGAYRVALVEGDWHWGPIAVRQQAWFQAAVGSGADLMQKEASGDPTDKVVKVLTAQNNQPVSDSPAVVVITTTSVTVRLKETAPR